MLRENTMQINYNYKFGYNKTQYRKEKRVDQSGSRDPESHAISCSVGHLRACPVEVQNELQKLGEGWKTQYQTNCTSELNSQIGTRLFKNSKWKEKEIKYEIGGPWCEINVQSHADFASDPWTAAKHVNVYSINFQCSSSRIENKT